MNLHIERVGHDASGTIITSLHLRECANRDTPDTRCGLCADGIPTTPTLIEAPRRRVLALEPTPTDDAKGAL